MPSSQDSWTLAPSQRPSWDGDYSDDEDDEEEFPDGIPCALCALILTTGEMRTLYSYSGDKMMSRC